MPFEIVRNDIAKISADAIVNAANTQLLQGGGVCGAIFAAAGESKLQAACDAIGHCSVGHSVITPGFALPARYVIHTVGPVWQGGDHHEAALLKSCYRTALQLAVEHQLESIAFPLISAGIYGYPKAQALQIATQAIREFLQDHELSVTLVVFEKGTVELSEVLQERIAQYIDDNYVDQHARRRGKSQLNLPDRNEYPVFDEQKFSKFRVHENVENSDVAYPKQPNVIRYFIMHENYESKDLSDVLDQLDDTFSQRVLRLIDQKGQTDVMVYKSANIDRKLFSKIRSDVNYKPSKATALALGIALELSIDEMADLLKTAGYSLSHSNRCDVIIEYFIQEHMFDIDVINETLFSYDQPLLGA